MPKQTLKKTILKIHELLGLATGLVVFIVSITGCFWVFKDEIQSLYIEDWHFENQTAPMLPPSQAKQIAQQIFPNQSVHGTLYRTPDKAIEVIFYDPEPEFYQSVFLHPSTGDVLRVDDHTAGFFHFVLHGHLNLWLPEEMGSKIVTYSILLFLITLTTGLYLWWPKQKNHKQRMSFSWKKSTRWRRKNFDLHAIAGFYVYSLAFILAFTGCVMAFDWFQSAVYQSTGGDKTPEFIIPNNKTVAQFETGATLPMDTLIPQLQQRHPKAKSFEIHYPHTDSTSIYVEIVYQEGVYYSSDYRFYDQTTLEEIDTPSIYGRYVEASFADKLMRMNYDIHVGAIGGLAGKIIAFSASLLIATLPITGFLLWYGRRYKAKAPVPHKTDTLSPHQSGFTQNVG